MADNPLDQLSALLNKAGEMLKQHGLELQTFAVLPNPDPNGSHMVQLIAVIGEDAFKTNEQKKIDAQFEQIALQEKHEATQRRIEDAARESRAALQEMMREDGGIGLDMETTVDPLTDLDDDSSE